MTHNSNTIIKLLQIMSWILFIGLCIETGGLIFNTVFCLFYNPVGALKFWKQINLSNLLAHSQHQFIIVTVLMCIVSLLKSCLFYVIVKIFHDKQMDFRKPFNNILSRYIFKCAYISFGIAFFCNGGYQVINSLETVQIRIPSIQMLGLAGADVWLLTGILLFVFAQLFKVGVDLQSENDLTI